jgi:hypothetical protein
VLLGKVPPVQGTGGGALQTPAVQASPAAHLLPQVPQLLTSVALLVQEVPQKFGVAVGQQLVPEATSPVGQEQTPPMQAFAAPVQTPPQTPQLFGSVEVFTQVWFGAVPQMLGSAGFGQVKVPPPSQLMRPVYVLKGAPTQTLL